VVRLHCLPRFAQLKYNTGIFCSLQNMFTIFWDIYKYKVIYCIGVPSKIAVLTTWGIRSQTCTSRRRMTCLHLFWLGARSTQYSLEESMSLLLAAHSSQQWSLSPPAHAGAGSGRQSSSLFPLKGRGFASVARWRNRRGRLRDPHESCRQAGSTKKDVKRHGAEGRCSTCTKSGGI